MEGYEVVGEELDFDRFLDFKLSAKYLVIRNSKIFFMADPIRW